MAEDLGSIPSLLPTLPNIQRPLVFLRLEGIYCSPIFFLVFLLLLFLFNVVPAIPEFTMKTWLALNL